MRLRVVIMGVVDVPDAQALLALGMGKVSLFPGMKVPIGRNLEAVVVEGGVVISKYKPQSVK
jgi:hypothetical protein